jgi:hypothetical protein
MPRDPLDELIEELEKAVPPRPLGDPRRFPNVHQYGELLCYLDKHYRERPRPLRAETNRASEAAPDVQDDDSDPSTEH